MYNVCCVIQNLKMLLHKVDIWKSDVLLQFDNSYNKVNKIEILMVSFCFLFSND